MRIIFIYTFILFFSVTLLGKTCQALSNGEYKIVAKHNGKVIDRHGNGNLYLLGWHKGNNQRFRVERHGSHYKITVVADGLSWDHHPDNHNLYAHPWHPDNPNQKFNIEQLSDGWFKVTSNGRVLDANLDGSNNVYFYHHFHGGDNQRWRFIPVVTKNDGVCGGANMTSHVELHPDGRVIGNTYTRTKVKLRGYTGGVGVVLLDAARSPLWSGSWHRYGVDGCYIGTCKRHDDWMEHAPAHLVKRTRYISVVQKCSPKNPLWDWAVKHKDEIIRASVVIIGAIFGGGG